MICFKSLLRTYLPISVKIYQIIKIQFIAFVFKKKKKINFSTFTIRENVYLVQFISVISCFALFKSQLFKCLKEKIFLLNHKFVFVTNDS